MESEDRAPYGDLAFPNPPADRPYLAINMVSTIDGKILTGERDEPVMDLGSAIDHQAMRHIERACDAIIIGAGSLRATPRIWYPMELVRIVVSRSGKVPFGSRFFTDAPEKAFVCTDAELELPAGVRRLPLDLGTTLSALRSADVRMLLSEGGSELNASLLALNVVDELFLTLAPKIKLGRDVPTYAGGEPLSRSNVQGYTLVEFHRCRDEVFLRYRRAIAK